MGTEINKKSDGYRIGAVARLTGLTADNLRVWERRYQAVTPARTGSGDRYYSTEDVARLKLMKRLVDAGDSISAIAALDQNDLDARLSEIRPATVSISGLPCRVVVIGESLSRSMEAADEELTSLDLVGTFDNAAVFETRANRLKADVLVVEQATLHTDTAIQICDWLNQLMAHTVIVIYRFAARDALARLPVEKCIALRAPVEPLTIQKQCVNKTAVKAAPLVDLSELLGSDDNTVPARRFDDDTLARLAQVSTTVKCECPLHLSELISSLSAFERYSSECESRNARDAALHHYLNETASRARYLIEAALSKVIEVDNIKL